MDFLLLTGNVEVENDMNALAKDVNKQANKVR